jgi:hypothetical protein
VQSGGSSTLLNTSVTQLTSSGNITQSAGNFSTAGNITQSTTGATATLKTTTVDSLSTAGNITQTSTGTTTLKAATVDSLTTAGNITQTGTGTTTLKATTVDSLSTAGNITQTGAAATTTLKAVTCDSLSITSGGGIFNAPVRIAASSGTSITLTGINTNANVVEVSLANVGINANNSLVLRVGTSAGILTTNVYKYVCYQRWSLSFSSVGSGSISGFVITNNLNNSERIFGNIRLVRVDTGYIMDGTLKATNGGDETIIYIDAGYVATSTAIDRVLLTSVNSTSTFNVTGATIQAVAH